MVEFEFVIFWTIITIQIIMNVVGLFKYLLLFSTYSRTSLSRTRLFRITAYLEVKIWSLF